MSPKRSNQNHAMPILAKPLMFESVFVRRKNLSWFWPKTTRWTTRIRDLENLEPTQSFPKIKTMMVFIVDHDFFFSIYGLWLHWHEKPRSHISERKKTRLWPNLKSFRIFQLTARWKHFFTNAFFPHQKSDEDLNWPGNKPRSNHCFEWLIQVLNLVWNSSSKKEPSPTSALDIGQFRDLEILKISKWARNKFPKAILISSNRYYWIG